MPNVVFAGVKPYLELPKWAKAVDVCVLPFTQTSLMFRSSPLKLREYLSLQESRLSLSVPLPEAKLLGKLVVIAADGPEFVRAIRKSSEPGTSPELAVLRRKAVEGSIREASSRDMC